MTIKDLLYSPGNSTQYSVMICMGKASEKSGYMYVCLCAKLLHSGPTLCGPRGCSPPGSSSRQEYCSGLPCPCPGELPNPGIEPASPALGGRFFTTEPPGQPDTQVLVRPFVLAFPLCSLGYSPCLVSP